MNDALCLGVFWLSAAFVLWVHGGFPLLLAVRALRPRPEPQRGGRPRVSYVVVVYNERAVIDQKLANIEATRYPRDLLEVIVVSDGSDDGTGARVKQHSGTTPVRLLALPRVGKNAALNAGVAAASGEILVFSDADSMLEPEALERLVAPFADPEVGGVAGDYRYTAIDGEGEGERSHWRLDRIWKRLEARAGSMTSATGQIYAIRSELFEPVPDGVTDDFFVSTGAIAQGLRLWYEPAAIASGPVAVSSDDEFRRKVRVMGRGFASVWQRRKLLDPRQTGFYALQLLSHKVLRRLVGIPLLGLALSAPLLAGRDVFYLAVAIGQVVFHSVALLGWLLRGRRIGRSRVLALPLFVDLVSLAGLIALSDFLRGRQHRGWVPQRSPVERDASASPESR